MSDLVERLRESYSTDVFLMEVADEIERLRAALESIANEFTHCPISEWDDGINCMARKALATLKGADDD